MTLAPGSRIGPYEITATLGAGGMGHVYRARDARLNRDVAIKALPEVFSLDRERVARFEREAQILASLSHPNIGGIYGVEEADGARFLVLELIAGESLADRLERGPVPLDEALAAARQIVDALEAAHDKGIVHRDLKPANIMLAPDGRVKVLDFGLAKAVAPDGSSVASEAANSPTLTFASTQLGVILGTAAYMSPEQAKGRVADRRSDVWAFGCVLYELLTGSRAFGGDDVSDTLAAIIRGEPDWTRLAKGTPPAIDRLLRWCLQKDRRQRMPDISVARFEIDACLSGTPDPSATAAPPPSQRSMALVAVGAALAGAIASAALFLLLPAFRRSEAAPPLPLTRFDVDPPVSSQIAFSTVGPAVDFVVSPDGSGVVYRVTTPSGPALALRRLAETESRILPGTADAESPSFSPDGTAIAFVAQDRLMRLPLDGRSPVVVRDAPGILGTAWLDADTLIWASDSVFREHNGGAPEILVKAGEGSDGAKYRFPQVIDADTILMNVEVAKTRHIVARRLSSGDERTVVENASNPRYVDAGYLTFVQNGRLMAAGFDRSRLQLSSAPVAIEQPVVVKFSGAAAFDVSRSGTLVRSAGSPVTYTSRFVWRGRDGKVGDRIGAVDLEYPRHPRISPDGRRLAAAVGPGRSAQIWVFDLVGSAQPLKLTFAGHNVFPTWTPRRSLIFAHLAERASADLTMTLQEVPSDGTSLGARTVATFEVTAAVPAVSPDGRWLLYAASGISTSGGGLTLKGLDPPVADRPWLDEPFANSEPAFSPDGKLVAYVTTQNGVSEVRVRPFPGPGAPIGVSPAGGHEPVWARDGKALFYQEKDTIMAADVISTSPELRFAAPRMLFQGGFMPFVVGTPRTYDVAPDGRFLMIEDRPSQATTVLTVTTGWTEIVKSRVGR